jgi:hypothetical protein
MWHLSPTRSYVRAKAELLARSWSAMLFRMAEAIDTPRPSESNCLSHVVALSDSARPQVLFTGDAGFVSSPTDSLSSDWEEVVSQVALLDVPHHGGEWGEFGSRALPVLTRRSAPPLVFASIGSRKATTPGRNFPAFAQRLSGRPGATFLASNQPGAAGSMPSHGQDSLGRGPVSTLIHMPPDRPAECCSRTPGSVRLTP